MHVNIEYYFKDLPLALSFDFVNFTSEYNTSASGILP